MRKLEIGDDAHLQSIMDLVRRAKANKNRARMLERIEAAIAIDYGDEIAEAFMNTIGDK